MTFMHIKTDVKMWNFNVEIESISNFKSKVKRADTIKLTMVLWVILQLSSILALYRRIKFLLFSILLGFAHRKIQIKTCTLLNHLMLCCLNTFSVKRLNIFKESYSFVRDGIPRVSDIE